MKILAVDTTGNVCSAAVLNDRRILSEAYVDNKRTHSEELAPMVDYCLNCAGTDIREIELFCCAVGPGSYTGIRIGTGMIKAFAHASGKPAVGINTLDALALNVSEQDGIICPVIDARRGEVYTAVYKCGIRVGEYRFAALTDILEELHGQRTIFLGDAALNYRDRITAASESFIVAQENKALQRAGSVGLAAFDMYKKGLTTDAYELAPFYMRETQAERVLMQKGGENAH